MAPEAPAFKKTLHLKTGCCACIFPKLSPWSLPPVNWRVSHRLHSLWPTVLPDWAMKKVGHLYLFVACYTWYQTLPATQGKVTPSPWDPFFQLLLRLDPPLVLKGVTESSLVPAACLFPPCPPSKIPDIPAISGAMFIWQNKCSGGREEGRGTSKLYWKRASLTNSLGCTKR